MDIKKYIGEATPTQVPPQVKCNPKVTADDCLIWKSRFPNLTWSQPRTEIERQKQLFMLQHEDKNKMEENV